MNLEGEIYLISYERKPTFDNLKNSILKDSVGRNKSIVNFIAFLDEIDGNIAIALDDSWGNGKTFFVKQTQMVLQSLDLSDENLNEVKECMKKFLKRDKARNYLPVYYDAWSNDNDIDPVLSIIFKMIQDVDGLEDYEANDKSWRDVFVTAVEAAVTAFGGPRIKAFFDSVEGTDILTEIKKRKQSDQVLNQLFDTLLEKQPADTRILFFIDELDRCCPNFAVRLLERIKHYFLHERIIFDKYNDFLQGKDSSSFAEVIPPNHADWLCEILLDRANETFFLRVNATSTIVSLAEKFQPVYECMFGNSTQAVRIPADTIYPDDKNDIMNVISLMRASQNLKGGNNDTD